MPYSKGTQKGTLILTTTQIEREREGERTREREGEREREVSRSSFGLDRALTQEHLGRKGFGKRHKLPVKLIKIAQDTCSDQQRDHQEWEGIHESGVYRPNDSVEVISLPATQNGAD